MSVDVVAIVRPRGVSAKGGAWVAMIVTALSCQRVRGNPRSIFDVPGSGQRCVTILARV
jgi:hypothetical protein